MGARWPPGLPGLQPMERSLFDRSSVGRLRCPTATVCNRSGNAVVLAEPVTARARPSARRHTRHAWCHPAGSEVKKHPFPLTGSGTTAAGST